MPANRSDPAQQQQQQEMDLQLLAGLVLARRAVGLRRLLLVEADLAGVVRQLRGPEGARWREVTAVQVAAVLPAMLKVALPDLVRWMVIPSPVMLVWMWAQKRRGRKVGGQGWGCGDKAWE